MWVLNMVALWYLLLAICFVIPIEGAIVAVKHAKTGFGGYLLAIAIGLVVASSSTWTMWATHKIVRPRPDWKLTASQQEWYFGAFYIAKILWVLFAGFVGFWLASALLRLVS